MKYAVKDSLGYNIGGVVAIVEEILDPDGDGKVKSDVIVVSPMTLIPLLLEATPRANASQTDALTELMVEIPSAGMPKQLDVDAQGSYWLGYYQVRGKREKSRNTMGENIRARREKAGKTQEQIAEEVGLSRPHYGKIESGAASPKVSTLARIAEALGTTADDLSK